MLGRLRMTVDECIEVYGEMSADIFRKQHHRLKLDGKVQGQFDKNILERAMQRCIARAGFSKDALLYDPDDASCRVFVCAMSKETSEITQFTSYVSRDGMSDLLKSAKIWEAARATSAATSFFDPIKIGPNREEFVDGAFGANNPIQFMWYEAQLIWPSIRLEDQIETLVSIGTGEPGMSDVGEKFWDIFETLKKQAADTQKTADHFKRNHRDLVRNKQYYRFNVDHGLEGIGFEEYAKKGKIVAATRHYLRVKAEYDLEDFANKAGAVSSRELISVFVVSRRICDVLIFSLLAQLLDHAQSPQRQPISIALPSETSRDRIPISAPSRDMYTFHTLSDKPKYIDRNQQVPWRKLTEPSITVYEKIYEAAKGPDDLVECESLNTESFIHCTLPSLTNFHHCSDLVQPTYSCKPFRHNPAYFLGSTRFHREAPLKRPHHQPNLHATPPIGYRLEPREYFGSAEADSSTRGRMDRLFVRMWTKMEFCKRSGAMQGGGSNRKVQRS